MENADEWGLAVSGSVASHRALIGCHGRRCPNAPSRLKAVLTGRFQSVVSENATTLPTPPRLASSRTRHPDRATSRARSPPRRRPSAMPLPERATAAVAKPSTVSGARAPPPLAAFSSGTVEPSFLSPSTPMQDHRRPLEPSPRRRTPPPLIWFSPSRR
jgi:hypothetical protein